MEATDIRLHSSSLNTSNSRVSTHSPEYPKTGRGKYSAVGVVSGEFSQPRASQGGEGEIVSSYWCASCLTLIAQVMVLLPSCPRGIYILNLLVPKQLLSFSCRFLRAHISMGKWQMPPKLLDAPQWKFCSINPNDFIYVYVRNHTDVYFLGFGAQWRGWI